MDKEQFQTLENPNQKLHSKIITKSRLFFVLFLISSLIIFFITNSFFNLRFTEITKREGQLNLTKNASNIVNELQKNSIIAQLLVHDQEITKALISKDFSLLPDKFAGFIADISVASITLLDKNGNLVAFSAKEKFEKKILRQIFSHNANKEPETIMRVYRKEFNDFGFFYSRQINYEDRLLGVILIEVDLKKFEQAWIDIGDCLLYTSPSPRDGLLSRMPSSA